MESKPMPDAIGEREIVIRLKTVPNAAPTVVRLRRALKVLLRSFGLRCVECKWDGQDGAN